MAAAAASNKKSPDTLQKLVVTSHPDDKFKDPKVTFTCQINPESISHGYGTAVKKSEAADSQNQKYTNLENETLGFSFILDGTGIISELTVEDQLLEIEKLTAYSGDIHQTKFLSVVWGERLTFNGLLTSLDYNHTLFSASGKILRTKVTMKLTQIINAQQESAYKKKSSPDMTHIRIMQDGGSLPIMCHEIYNDSTRYLDVAMHNNLVDFRNIKPGTEIVFPPLK